MQAIGLRVYVILYALFILRRVHKSQYILQNPILLDHCYVETGNISTGSTIARLEVT